MEVGAISLSNPVRRLFVPPLAGLEGQGCGSLGGGGSAGGMSHSLPVSSSSVLGTQGIDADSDAAVKLLQEDLRKVGEWSKKWQMPFNLDKCKIMHIGHKNKNEKYELLGREIESVQQEKDLGVVITNDLKSSNQCIEAVKKAQKLLGYIKRQFRTRNKDNINSI